MHPTQSTTKKKKQTMPNPSPAPPPYYITSATPPAYCHTCGRIISSKRTTTPSAKKQEATATNAKTAPKFCSDRCKRHKPSSSPSSAEAHVEKALVALLEGRPPPPPYKSTSADAGEPEASPVISPVTKKKGESRVLLPLSILEEAVFGSRSDPERCHGRRRNRAFRGMREDGQWRSVDMEDDHEGGYRPEPIDTWKGAEDFDGDDLEFEGGVKLNGRRGEDESEEIEEGEAETPELAARRRAGQKKAEEREFVRCVVRRAVVFGLELEGWRDVGGGIANDGKKGKRGKGRSADADDEVAADEVKPRRKCEAVMSGQVVEPSFAKGDWSVRWRDD